MGYFICFQSFIFKNPIYIHTVHGSLLNRYAKLDFISKIKYNILLNIEKFLFKNTHLLFCSDEDMSFYTENNIDSLSKDRFRYYVGENTIKRSLSSIKNNRFKFIFVAGFRDQKRQLDFLKSWKISGVLKNELHFFGSGKNEKKCKDFVKTNDIKNVFFHGFVSKDELHNFSKKNNCIGCLVSYFEGQPLGLIEYLSQGIPIIVNSYSGTGEIFKHKVGYKLPLNFKLNDCANIIKKASKMSKIEYYNYSKKSLLYFKKYYSKDNTVIKYVKLIENKL